MAQKSRFKETIIAKTRFVHLVRETTRLQRVAGKLKPVKIKKEVFKVPTGGHVIPYFQDPKDSRWKVVLVEQYRLAIKRKTLEAPGGIINGKETPQEGICRELEEEAGIAVSPDEINIVLKEYILPPLIEGQIYGAIVEIDPSLVKDKNESGLSRETEWTKVRIFNLRTLIRRRHYGLIRLDLLTSRILDEIIIRTLLKHLK